MNHLTGKCGFKTWMCNTAWQNCATRWREHHFTRKKLHEIHMKLDIFKRIKYKNTQFIEAKKNHNLTATRWQFLQWLHLTDFRLVRPDWALWTYAACDDTTNTQLPSTYGVLVGRCWKICAFFSGKFEWNMFVDMICIKMLLKFRAFACRWWIHSFHTFDSFLIEVQKRTFGAMSCHCPV